jgi:DNA-binding transcriptional MerR regulator
MTDTRLTPKQKKAAKLRAGGQPHEAIASAVGVTKRTVERWQSKGLLPELPKNGNGNGAMTLTEARTRKESALARLRELDVELREADYIPRAEYKQDARDFGARVREQLLAWPGRVAAEIAADLDVDASLVGSTLEGYVRRLLTDMADGL